MQEYSINERKEPLYVKKMKNLEKLVLEVK